VYSRTPTRVVRAALVAVMLVTTGCVTPTGVELPDISEWDRRAMILGQLDEFDFRGRIAVSAGGDGFNGKFSWYQDEDAFRATVSGPLGIGTVLIEGDERLVEVTDKDDVKTVLDDVEADLYVRYGWTIPVESLRYWALGIPDPRVPAETSFNAAGELTELMQRGWTVAVDGYREAGGGQPMPRRLTASNTDTKVRLVIDRWVFRDTIEAL